MKEASKLKCLDEVVVCAVHIAVERMAKQREMVSSLICTLHQEGAIDEASLVRGFAKLVCMWEDLILDSGRIAATALVEMLLSCIKCGCVEQSFLLKLPEGLLVMVIKDGAGKEAAQELQKVANQMQVFKQDLDQAKLLEPCTRFAANSLSSRETTTMNL